MIPEVLKSSDLFCPVISVTDHDSLSLSNLK